jgi:hypothetical protein
MKTLQQTTDFVINKLFKVKPHETVLIITNPNSVPFKVAQSFYKSSLKKTSHTVMLMQEARTNIDTMEDFVSKAIALNPDVIIVSSRYSLGRDPIGRKNNYIINNSRFDNILYYLRFKKALRTVWFYVYSIDRFIESLNIDYSKMQAVSSNLINLLNTSKEVHIETSAGTDLYIDLSNKKRVAKADFSGSLAEPGKGGNLPVGEVLISPTIGGVKGKAVIDGSFHYGKTYLLKNPVTITFKDGYVDNITSEDNKVVKVIKGMIEDGFNCEGKVAKELEPVYKKNSRAIGEFAIGVNPNAQIVGEMIEDEKTYGSCHFAIGASYDGDPALFHSDFVMKQPKITFHLLDGTQKVVLENYSFNF